MTNLTIVITTFKHRFESCCNLIKQVRNYQSTTPIIIVVNGEYDEPFDEQYRSNLLKFISDVPFCYPIFHTEFRSLAKMWNLGIVNASTEYCWILNDDVEVTNNEPFKAIEKEIELKTDLACVPAYSYSHFLITKSLCEEIGFFEERLLGIGEEDGDFQWRYENYFGKHVKHVECGGARNKADYNHVPNMECHQGNKASFNRKMIYDVLYTKKDAVIKSMFDVPLFRKQFLEREYYPSETFFRHNKHKLRNP